MSSNVLADADVSYVGELRSLVKEMAEGKFTTPPEIERAMNSLKGYIVRIRRDFYGIDPRVQKFMRGALELDPAAVKPAGIKHVGRGYLPIVTAFEKMVADREVESILRS